MIQQRSRSIMEPANGEHPLSPGRIGLNDTRKFPGGAFDSALQAISNSVSRRPGLMLLTGFTVGTLVSFVVKRRK